MALLVLGLIIFVLSHLIPCFPDRRTQLIDRFGAGGYKGLFSLISSLGLVLIVLGLMQADFVELYQPATWTKHVTFLLMYIALYLFFSTSVGPAPSTAKTLTAHPMSWGVVVWSVAHLLSNGDLAHVLLFSGFLIYSFISIISGNRRGLKPALTSRPKLQAELTFMGIVLLIYVVLMWAHRYFTGMPLM